VSEVINLIDGNPDAHVYLDAVNILKEKLNDDYSFVLQVWDHEIPEDTKYKKILILTSDENHGTPKQANDKDVHHIFKQYVPMSNIKSPSAVLDIKNVSALPLCHLEGHSRQEPKPIRDRELTWSWAGQHDPFARGYFKCNIEVLKKYSDERKIPYECLWYKGWNNGVPISEYSDMVNNTKVMFAPNGSASLETFRFFEAMMSGCIVLSFNELPHGKIYNLYNNMLKELKKELHDAYFRPFGVKDISTMKDIIDWVDFNPDKAQEMSADAMKWYDMMCSPEGLSEYMIQELENKNV
jgi:hypothetical protein